MSAIKSAMKAGIHFINQVLRLCCQKILTTSLVLAMFLNSFAQNDLSPSLSTDFNAYNKEVLQEILFVHTDKDVYLAGEILWFKIYDVDAFFHTPLSISFVAYVEILDEKNKPMTQVKVAMQKGDGNGSIYLPFTMNSGNYTFRAYTNWMKNFSSGYFFKKSITIFNTQKKTIPDSTSQAHQQRIDFFPEGGNLVNGLPGKVAFKVSDEYGKGLDCQGILIDDQRDTLLSFHPLKFGMGNFSFTPALGHSYKAIIRFPGGTQMIKELPIPYKQGLVMHLAHTENGQLEITVLQSPNIPAQADQLIYLFVHTRGSIKWVGGRTVQNGKAVFRIDTSKLGDGISHITVFDSNKLPLCERLYFKYPNNRLQLQIKTDLREYECRKKINLDIFSGDREGNPKIADLSLAVYRIDSLQPADEVNIENYLWLSADLPGKIESPGYYFSNRGPQVDEVLDNLMLTWGWRRFSWEDILQNKKPAFEFLPELNGHLISGKITRSKTGLPGEHIDCYISVPGPYTQFRNAMSNGDGNIKFEMKNFYGSAEIIVQTNARQDSGFLIDIANPFFRHYDTTPLPRFLMPVGNSQNLSYATINTEAQQMYLGSKLKQFMAPPVDTVAFYGHPDEKYILDNYTRFTTLEEIFREYVKAVNISKKEGRFTLELIDQHSKLKFEGRPLTLLDGVPIFDIDKFIRNFDPLKIYKMEVVRRKYIYGYESFDGILNLNTYS